MNGQSALSVNFQYPFTDKSPPINNYKKQLLKKYNI